MPQPLSESMLTAALVLPLGLLIAYVIGQIARWIARNWVTINTPTTVVLSVAGMSLGMLFSTVMFPRSKPWSVEVLLLSIALTVLLLSLFAVVAKRFQPPKKVADVDSLIAQGESQRVEFKSSARYNLHSKVRDEKIELVIAKTVAGFLNADGGTLLIGVNDEGRVVGLARDFSLIKQADPDRYELWLRDFLSTVVGQTTAALARVDFAPYEVDGEQTFVCRVVCPRSPRPVFLDPGKGKNDEFWVRSGNSTRQLGVRDASDYVMFQWPLGVGRAMTAQLRSAARGSGW
ncbi:MULTISPECIES: ATP-binding protein [Arthrobacter]|uniref:ATP-binding protein n=2 Tax=Arthrobacter TaxID=1663 RepID=A0ABU9KNB8_9MICC|nr:ATP-binding protein [Arthrobacter sp. YJM1]MDP5228310.1 ATP-binding protein [Arthrobacter sp. YJM1]